MLTVRSEDRMVALLAAAIFPSGGSSEDGFLSERTRITSGTTANGISLFDSTAVGQAGGFSWSGGHRSGNLDLCDVKTIISSISRSILNAVVLNRTLSRSCSWVSNYGATILER